MALRYDRDTYAAVTLTGGMRVHFPEDTYEISLDDPEFEKEVAEQYDAVEYVPDEDDLCGTIKTNGEPCDRLADECHFHSQDDDSEDEDDADAESERSDSDAEVEADDSEDEDEDADADEDDGEDEDADESESYDYDL